MGVWVPYILVEIVAFSITGWNITSKQFLLDITLIEPQYCFGWYLNYLFIQYAIFWSVHKIRISENKKVILFGIITLALMPYFNSMQSVRFE